MKLLKLCCITAALWWSAVIEAETAHPTVQRNIALVGKIAEPIGHPHVLQAILLQESNGGLNTTSNTASYGLMQVQVVAARSVLQRVPEVLMSAFPGQQLRHISDAAIKHKLKTDDVFNITVAAHHFDIYFNLCRGNLEKAIAAYNMGIGGVQRVTSYSAVPYVRRIKQQMQRVQSITPREDA